MLLVSCYISHTAVLNVFEGSMLTHFPELLARMLRAPLTLDSPRKSAVKGRGAPASVTHGLLEVFLLPWITESEPPFCSGNQEQGR